MNVCFAFFFFGRRFFIIRIFRQFLFESFYKTCVSVSIAVIVHGRRNETHHQSKIEVVDFFSCWLRRPSALVLLQLQISIEKS